MMDIKYQFTCGVWKRFESAAKFQNIKCKIVLRVFLSRSILRVMIRVTGDNPFLLKRERTFKKDSTLLE